MADRRCLRHVSVVVGTFVMGAGMSSCTQSPARNDSATPICRLPVPGLVARNDHYGFDCRSRPVPPAPRHPAPT
jgi:hypothetical protein